MRAIPPTTTRAYARALRALLRALAAGKGSTRAPFRASPAARPVEEALEAATLARKRSFGSSRSGACEPRTCSRSPRDRAGGC